MAKRTTILIQARDFDDGQTLLSLVWRAADACGANPPKVLDMSGGRMARAREAAWQLHAAFWPAPPDPQPEHEGWPINGRR